MFDHRLGLALSKSIGEIRALPYPEYHDWELFYLLEPWGWANEEYQMAMIISMIHNTNVKDTDQKEPAFFMRKMMEMITEQLAPEPELNEMSAEDRRELIRNAVKKDLGIL